jgi:hypothetical protein
VKSSNNTHEVCGAHHKRTFCEQNADLSVMGQQLIAVVTAGLETVKEIRVSVFLKGTDTQQSINEQIICEN